jgi:hypothetical protein
MQIRVSNRGLTMCNVLWLHSVHNLVDALVDVSPRLTSHLNTLVIHLGRLNLAL